MNCGGDFCLKPATPTRAETLRRYFAPLPVSSSVKWKLHLVGFHWAGVRTQWGCTFKERSGLKEVDTLSMNRYVLGAAGHLSNRRQNHTQCHATRVQENRSVYKC